MAVRFLSCALLVSLFPTRLDTTHDDTFYSYLSCANDCRCSREKVSGKVLAKCNFAGKNLSENSLLLPPDVDSL